MLFGITVIKWDKKYGMRVEAKYPENLDINDTITKQIYTNHEFEEEAGFLSLSIGDLNLASYYTGDTDYYMVVLLSIDERPENYEDILSDTIRRVMSQLKGKKYIEELPNYFKHIATYPKMTDEQKLALILLDPIKKMILDRLIEDSTLTKSELSAWLRDKYGSEYIDVDSIVNSMLRNKLIREETLETMTSSSIFLIGDIFVSRVPPRASIARSRTMKDLDSSVLRNYLDDVRTFFEKYSPNPEDTELILDLITDVNCYTVVKELRVAPVSQKSKTYQRLYGSIENFDETLQRLWEAQMISVLKDKKGQEYLFLRSDIKVKYVFPEYLIDKIRQIYYEGSQPDFILIEHLRILQDRYGEFKEH
ncbi:MAG: hypothetical protein HWN67_22090 [Candidatus Helarchaeota archaeon]|nr:hypothetical protein [Candidatus Helarchaeota archaeon]